MTVTLSPPVRIFVFVGVLAAAGLGALLLLARPTPSSAPEPAAVSPRTKAGVAKPAPARPAARPKPAQNAKPRPSATQSRTGFPLPIDRALRHNRVVLVAVYMPGSTLDRAVLAETRAAALESRTAYVAVSAASERVARQLLAKTGVLPQPAVLVLRRPGVVTATLGVTDRGTIVQAIALARR